MIVEVVEPDLPPNEKLAGAFISSKYSNSLKLKL